MRKVTIPFFVFIGAVFCAAWFLLRRHADNGTVPFNAETRATPDTASREAIAQQDRTQITSVSSAMSNRAPSLTGRVVWATNKPAVGLRYGSVNIDSFKKEVWSEYTNSWPRTDSEGKWILGKGSGDFMVFITSVNTCALFARSVARDQYVIDSQYCIMSAMDFQETDAWTVYYEPNIATFIEMAQHAANKADYFGHQGGVVRGQGNQDIALVGYRGLTGALKLETYDASAQISSDVATFPGRIIISRVNQNNRQLQVALVDEASAVIGVNAIMRIGKRVQDSMSEHCVRMKGLYKAPNTMFVDNAQYDIDVLTELGERFHNEAPITVESGVAKKVQFQVGRGQPCTKVTLLEGSDTVCVFYDDGSVLKKAAPFTDPSPRGVVWHHFGKCLVLHGGAAPVRAVVVVDRSGLVSHMYNGDIINRNDQNTTGVLITPQTFSIDGAEWPKGTWLALRAFLVSNGKEYEVLVDQVQCKDISGRGWAKVRAYPVRLEASLYGFGNTRVVDVSR